MYLIWVNMGLLLFFVMISLGSTEGSNYYGAGDFQCVSSGQPYRTGFHFQPPKNWMNDPNGPMYYKGLYHLFYQYNPFSPLWNKNTTWAHSISQDLINWFHLDHALIPSEHFDINGCWSGSITFLDHAGKNPVILYTGIDSQDRQVQNLALPKNLSDPFLIEWSKSPRNPLMTPSNGLEPDLFRDPTTAWLGPDKVWRVIIGAQIDGKGMVILYKSRDFVKWNRNENPLHSSTNKMWECPDFFPVSVNSTNGVDFSDDQDQFSTKHVLKVSFNSQDYYILGKYVAKTDEFVAESDFLFGSDLRLDYGKFYASKTFYESANQRRILWGWVNESDSDADSMKKGWSGLQSFPRSIVLSKSGRQIIQWPIKEIEKLRSNKVVFQNKKLVLKSGSVSEVSGVTASQADVEVSFHVKGLEKAELLDPSWVDPQLLCSRKNASVLGKFGPFGLLVLASKDLTEQTAIFFRIFRSNEKYIVLMCSDQSRSSLREGLDKTTYGTFVDLDPSKEKITLRSLIDHSIVESFGGEGRSCITARVYPKLAIDEDAHLYAFNYGSRGVEISKLNAWSIKSAKFVSWNAEEYQ